MPLYCPNKNSQAWKDLVNDKGEINAYAHWHLYNGPKGGTITDGENVLNWNNGTKAHREMKLSEKGELEVKLGIRWNKYNENQAYPPKAYDYDEAKKFQSKLNKGKLKDSPYNAAVQKTTDESGKRTKYRLSLVISPKFQRKEIDPEKANNELNSLLISRMSELGVTTEAHEELKDRTGRDVAGVADIYQKIIRVSKGKEDRMTLPEETAHFLIRMMKDNKMMGKMKELAKKTDVYSKTFEEYKDNVEYQDENGNPIEDKIAEEAAGKILGEKIIKKGEKEGTPSSLMDIMRKIWDRFTSIFKRGSETAIQDDIDKVFGAVAEDVVSGNLERFDPSILKDGLFYSRGKDQKNDPEEKKKLERYEESLNKSINTVKKKIELNKAKGKDNKKFLDRENKLIRDLIKKRNQEAYMLGNVRFLEEIHKETTKIIGDREGETEEEFKGKFREIEEEIMSGDANKQKVFRKLRDIINYIGNYSDVVGTMANEVRADKEIDPKDRAYFIERLDQVQANIDRIRREYDRLGRQIMKDFLSEYSTNPESDLENIFDEPLDDVDVVTRYLDSMAESDNRVLMLVDKAVKESKETARTNTLKTRNLLLEAQKSAEEAGLKDLDFLYERDRNGDLTGNVISDVNWGEFIKQKNEFFNKLNKKYGLPEDKEKGKNIRNGDLRAVSQWYEDNKNEPGMKEWFEKEGAPDRRTFLLAISEKLRREYGKEAVEWFQENQESNPRAQELIDKRKKEMSPDEFNEWLTENMVTDRDGNPLHYIRDLGKPKKAKYKNKKYENLDETQKKLLQIVYDVLEEKNRKLPPRDRLGDKEIFFMAPQLRKDLIERARAKGAKRVGEEVRESFIQTENELDFGAIYNLTDENNEEVKMLPKEFTRELEDKRDLSTDMISALSLFTSMSENYSEMNKMVDALEVTKDIVGETDFKKVKAGKVVKQKLGISEESSYEVKKGNESFTYSRLQDYLNMIVYGELKKDEGNLLGTKLDQAKTIDALGSYTAFNNLAFNVYAGFANIGFGTAMMHTEATAKEFISPNSLSKATGKYYKELPKTLEQIGNRYRTDWLSAWNDRMDTLQDFKSGLYSMNTNRRSKIGQLFKTSSGFFMNHSGEHYMQVRMSLALGEEALVEDKNGNVKSLTEATYVEGNELKFEEGLKKHVQKDKDGNRESRMWFAEEHGEKLTDRDLIRFTNKQNFINKRLHGIYNDIDKSAIQQYSLGRLALMFRKFMKPGYNRRFEKLRYNEEGEAWTEGYYRTAGRFMNNLRKDLVQGKIAILRNWRGLNKRERANMIRFLTEAGYAALTFAAAAILTNLAEDGDDEEEWVLNMMAYQANRVNTELLFYTGAETLRILQSPAAAVDQVQSLTRTLDAMAFFHELERGPYKGWNEGLRNVYESIPPLQTVSETMTPGEKLKFFARD